MQNDQDDSQEPEDGGPSYNNDEGWINEQEDMTGERYEATSLRNWGTWMGNCSAIAWPVEGE